jgi:MFS family permease
MGRRYWTVWSATLLFFGAFYTLMIPLPLYLGEVGLADWQIGVILGALGITSLIVRPFAGVLADGWGRRPVMLIGTLSLVIGAIGVVYADHPSLFFLLRALQATGYVAFTTATTALIADLAAPERRASAMAVFGVAANVAMTTVPAIVSLLLGKITLAGAFWLSGALAAVGGLMALQVHTERSPGRAGAGGARLFTVLAKLWMPALTATLFGIGFGAFLQFMPLLIERRGLGSAGLVYTVYGLSIIATRLLTGRWLDRAHHGRVLAGSFALLALGLAGYAAAGAWPMLLVATMLVAGGSGVLHPLLISIHVQRASDDERGRATAIFYLGFDLGIGLGAWIFAPVFQASGLGALYLLAAVAALLGIGPAWVTGRAQRS